MRRKNNNFLTGVIVPLFLLVILIASQSAVVNAQSAETVSKQVEEAVLAEDWGKVAKLLDSVNPETPSPVLRMIKGHADLALNRNNESLCLFLSVSSEDDLNKWQEWSASFAEKNAKSVIALYFKGDALARLEKWDDALSSFNKALELNSKHAMVLNARGVTLSAKGKWDDALIDLTKATMLDDNFADAYASLGAMWVQRRTGPQGAEKSFKSALALSPEFVLAYNGKGAVEYALGHWEKANEDFGRAGKLFNCPNSALTIINRNLSIVAISVKRSQFPFFSKGDFVNWESIKSMIEDPNNILNKYFTDVELSDEVNDLIVSKFNDLLELPPFYDENKNELKFSEALNESNAGLNELIKLIKDTDNLRKKDFNNMRNSEKEKIRKLNRLILEYLLPKEIIQIAMNQIDSPGFSIERGVGFVDSWSHKSQMSSHELMGGTNRMQNTYRPLADLSAIIPFVGGAISNSWNRHLDNQIGINNSIMDSRGISRSPSGGVDFNMRKAHIDEGNWGVGTWFGLAYYVVPTKH